MRFLGPGGWKAVAAKFGRFAPLFAAFVVLVIGACDAWARPGGGHSYSGGSNSSGGGGSGEGGGEAIYFLIRLIFLAPEIGIPVTIAVVGFYIYAKRGANVNSNARWESGSYYPPPPPSLGEIRRLDPEFSVVLFEDFIYDLYSKAHQARSEPQGLDPFATHFSDWALRALRDRAPTDARIHSVVIGSLAPVQLRLPDKAISDQGEPNFVQLSMRIESNMRWESAQGAGMHYVDETWLLMRAANAESSTQKGTGATRCGNCGAPYADSAERQCQSCGQVVNQGLSSWLVQSIVANTIESRPPKLGGHSPELGTNDRTLVDPKRDYELHQLQGSDPQFSEDLFMRRSRFIFLELYKAWNADELALARPYVSDSLFNYLRYWLDSHREHGLKNVVKDFDATQYEIAKIVRDKHYDAITIRIWAHGKDQTINSKGKVVGGSKRRTRLFSEYWTMIRHASVKGKALAHKQCPQCGAEQKISMAGTCEYCESHITSGEFDWILSKIEQDESYRG